MRIRILAAALVAFACVAGCAKQPPPNPTLQAALKAHAAGKLDEAKTLYGQVLKDDPTNKYALYNLGLIAQTRNQFADATKDYQAALASDAKFVPALFNFGVLLTREGKTADAIAMYRRTIAASPKDAPAHLNLGFLLEGTGHTAEGEAEIREAVRLDPSLAKRVPTPKSPAPKPTATASR